MGKVHTNNYQAKRYKNDPLYKEFKHHKKSIHDSIKNYKLNGTQWKMYNVDCTVSELLSHLQGTAEANEYFDFNIYDYDTTEYHIDHIKPAKMYYDGEITIYELCHWSNLQILSSKDNIQKGAS